MILKNIKESLLTVVSLVWSLLQIVHSYLTLCYQMVHAFGVCLYQRFFKKNSIEPKCLICRSTSFNCGIVLVIILVFIALVFSFILKGKTNILQPVGCGSLFESSFDKSFSFLTPTNSLFGSFIFDVDDCSMLLLIF